NRKDITMFIDQFISRASQTSRFALASLLISLCQQSLVRSVQAQGVPRPNPTGAVVLRIDEPAIVNGTAGFTIKYSIINYTPEVLGGTVTAVFSGSSLAARGGPTSMRSPGPQVVSEKMSNRATGEMWHGQFEAGIPGDGTYSVVLRFCG